jgi:hypothetical protein
MGFGKRKKNRSVVGPETEEDRKEREALAEVERWKERLESDAQPSAAFVRAVAQGRLTFNEEEESFSYMLRKPLQLKNGSGLSVVKMREANGGQLRTASKGRKDDDLGVALHLMSLTNSIPLNVVEDLGAKDILIIGEGMGFFS